MCVFMSSMYASYVSSTSNALLIISVCSTCRDVCQLCADTSHLLCSLSVHSLSLSLDHCLSHTHLHIHVQHLVLFFVYSCLNFQRCISSLAICVDSCSPASGQSHILPLCRNYIYTNHFLVTSGKLIQT